MADDNIITNHQMQLSSKEDSRQMQLSSKEDSHQMQLSSKEDSHQMQLSSKEDSHQMQLSSKEDSHQMPINKKNGSLEKFEGELIGLYKKIEGEDVEAVVNAVRNSYKKFYDRVDKSEFNKEIVEWFDNNCEVIEDRKRRGIGLLNDRMIQELFLSIMKSIKIESDSEFYKFLDDEFSTIMF